MSFKTDQIVENYKGEFARIIRVADSMVHRTGWYKRQDVAERADFATVQNEPSLIKVLKDNKAEDVAEQKPAADTEKVATKAKADKK